MLIIALNVFKASGSGFKSYGVTLALISLILDAYLNIQCSCPIQCDLNYAQTMKAILLKWAVLDFKLCIVDQST